MTSALKDEVMQAFGRMPNETEQVEINQLVEILEVAAEMERLLRNPTDDRDFSEGYRQCIEDCHELCEKLDITINYKKGNPLWPIHRTFEHGWNWKAEVPSIWLEVWSSPPIPEAERLMT